MAMRDVVSDLTELLLPPPDRPSVGSDEAQLEGWSEVMAQVETEREQFAEQLRLAWDEADVDPLLAQLAAARSRMLRAERQLRLLIAYGREFVGPRPYRLEDLAHAAGMSISGVRTAYDDDEVAEVASRTGARPRRQPAAAPAAPAADSSSSNDTSSNDTAVNSAGHGPGVGAAT